MNGGPAQQLKNPADPHEYWRFLLIDQEFTY